MEEKLRDKLQSLSLQNRVSNYNLQSSKISEKYRNNKGGNGGVLSSKEEILTYAQVRMPSTFACINKVLNELDLSNCESLLDVGSGTGAGIIALCGKRELKKITAIEKQPEMIAVNKMITNGLISTEIDYVNQDILDAKIDCNYDVVLAGFVFNELTKERQFRLLEKLWKVTSKYLIIVEPGKPDNFRQMMRIKDFMKQNGVDVFAPCVNKNKCPLCTTSDWCHFIARVRRSSLQRVAKGGQISYEDEKFTYLVFSKESVAEEEYKRVIRRPVISKGKILHTVCTKNGIEKQTYSKRQNEIYKQAKDLEVGEKFNY